MRVVGQVASSHATRCGPARLGGDMFVYVTAGFGPLGTTHRPTFSQRYILTRADSALDKDEASGKANTPYYPGLVRHQESTGRQRQSFLADLCITIVQSAANTLPENIENTPKIPKEVEPSPPTPELVVEEPVEETMVDVPAPAEEAHLLKSQWQRSQNKVDVPKSEIEEPKAEATPEEVQAVEEAKEETPVVEETPVTTKAVVEVEESVEEVEKPAEVIDATTEGAKEE
ncbi:hypothetical protein Tco_0643617 [Tanacetum coccineum]